MSVGRARDSHGMQGSSGGHLHICPSQSLHKIHLGLHWFSSGKENSRGLNGGSKNTAHPRAGSHTHIRNPTAFPVSEILPSHRDERRGVFWGVFFRGTSNIPQGKWGNGCFSLCWKLPTPVEQGNLSWERTPFPRKGNPKRRIQIPLSHMAGVVNLGWSSGKGLG